MPPPPENRPYRSDAVLAERLEAITASLTEIDARVQATELATGDQKTAKELRRALEALAKHDPKLESRLTDRVDVLADRFATLASTVATTSAALARKDGEIAALHRELEEGKARIQTLGSQLARAVPAAEVEKLRTAVASMSGDRPARKSDSQIDDLARKTGLLTERVDTLAKTVATTAAGLAGRDGELATLRHRLEEGSAQVERALAELRQRRDDGKLGERLDILADGLATVTASLPRHEGEMGALRARIDEAYGRMGSVVTGLQESLAGLAAQVGALEQIPAATERALEEHSAALYGRVDTLAERLDSLAEGVETTLSALAETEAERASVHESLSAAVTAVKLQIAEQDVASSQWTEEATERTGELERLVAEVGGRLGAVERQRDDVLTRIVALERDRSALAAGELERLQAAVAERFDSVANEREALAARLDAMENDRQAVATEMDRMSELLAKEGERAALQESLSAAITAVKSRIAEQDVAASEWVKQADSRTGEIERLLAVVVDRIGTMERRSEDVVNRIVAVESDRATLGAEELERLQAGIEERLGSDASEREAVVGGRLQALESDRQAVATEIGRMSELLSTELSSVDSRLRQVATEVAHVADRADDAETAQRHAELAERVEAVEQIGSAVASEIARASAAWASTFETISARLDELAQREAASAAWSEGAASRAESIEHSLVEVAGRLAAIEGERDAVLARVVTVESDRETAAAEIDRVSESLEAEKASLETQLQAIARSVAHAVERTETDETGQRLAELAARLESVEEAGAAAASELARASAFWASELDAIAIRLDEIAEIAQDATRGSDEEAERLLTELNGRLDAIVHERHAVAAEIARASESEVAELRVLIDGLRTRFAPSDGDSRSPQVASRLNELTHRLDSVENLGAQSGLESEADPGDGRFLVELQALELRTERAEEAARENRDAVVGQLEQLSAQIESRFRRLESEQADPSDADTADRAEVVPLRGAEV